LELRHEFTVPAGIEQTWNAFNDIESVAGCFPGAALSSYDGESFEGLVKVKLGPISLQYTGTGSFVERDEATHRAVIEAKGKDKRGNGTAGAHVTATLSEAGTGTRVEVLTDLAITGKPAQFGRGVMQDVSDKLLGQFTACLEQKVTDGGAAAAVEDSDRADEPAPEPPVVEPPDNVRRMEPPAPVAPAPPAAGADDALDLGATVLPVLLKSYWRQALGAVLVLLVLRRLLRRG
jgi:carbon monoxide dehydrogenase subunit G